MTRHDNLLSGGRGLARSSPGRRSHLSRRPGSRAPAPAKRRRETKQVSTTRLRMIGRRRKDSMTGIHLILKFVRRTGNSARRFVTTYGSRNDMGETQPICRPALTSAQRKRAFGLLAAALAG